MTARITLMGCQVDNLTMEETLGRIAGFIGSGRPHQHVVVNVDKLVKASRDPALRSIINECALMNADSMPVVCKVKRAPRWMQDWGLEWFYRFLQEPRSMFRRYFIDDMAFIWLFIKEAAGRHI